MLICFILNVMDSYLFDEIKVFFSEINYSLTWRAICLVKWKAAQNLKISSKDYKKITTRNWNYISNLSHKVMRASVEVYKPFATYVVE